MELAKASLSRFSVLLDIRSFFTFLRFSVSFVTDSKFDTLHGITVSSDGQYVYVSGRGDGYIYKFDTISGQQVGSVQLVSTGMNRTGGIAITKQ